MKRLVSAVLAFFVMLLPAVSARADMPDFSVYSLDELHEIRRALDARIAELERAGEAEIYESGDYLVGWDIPAGDYVITEITNAVFPRAVVRSGEAEESDLVGYHLINHQAVIRFEESTWLTLVDASACPIQHASGSLDANGCADEGGYLVGRLLPAGTYSITPIENAPLSSYSVYGDILGSGAQLVKFEVLHEEVRIGLSDGEYIELSGCRLSKVN